MMRDGVLVTLGLSTVFALAGCGGGDAGNNSGTGGGNSGGTASSSGGNATSSGGTTGSTGGTTGSSGGTTGASGGTPGSGGNTPGSSANCEDYCARSTSCEVELCAQDGSPVPSILVDFLSTSCTALCTDQILEQSGFNSKWDCLFENSCRAVFGDDVCQASASYSCPTLE